jgi:large subunit ribosomal protein L9
MKVVLLQDVENLGYQGDVVVVKDGYGRNFLIPRGLAILATPGAIKTQEEVRKQMAGRLLKSKGDAETLAARIEGEEVVVNVRVGEENRIFGTVTPHQVAGLLAERGIEVDRRKIEIDEEIRLVGVYTASIQLHPEVSAKLKLRVEPEAAEQEG